MAYERKDGALSTGCGAEARPQQDFLYILSPEIVCDGNVFGSFCAPTNVYHTRMICRPVKIYLHMQLPWFATTAHDTPG